MDKSISPSGNRVVSVLKDAREFIATVGWVRGLSRSVTGARCAAAAIAGAADTHPGPESTRHDTHSCLACLASAALMRAIGRPPGCSVVAWNDEPGRTKEEVLAAFDKAIVWAEGEEASRG